MTSHSIGVAGAGDSPREVIEDSPDAPFVETHPLGDFRQRNLVALHPQYRSMRRRTFLKELFPKLFFHQLLARPSAGGCWNVPAHQVANGSFLFDRLAKMAAAVNHPMPSQGQQKRLELTAISELPARLAKAGDHVRPDGLNDIHRIKLDPQRPLQLASNGQPELRLELLQDLFDRVKIAAVEAFDQFIERLVVLNFIGVIVLSQGNLDDQDPGHPPRLASGPREEFVRDRFGR